MELRVLGPVEAHGPGGLVSLRPLERRLLAALVARRPDCVHVDELVDAMWGDRPPRSAVHTLQTHVLRARRALGTESISSVYRGYGLDAAVTTDVEAFEAAVLGATHAGDAPLNRWSRALALWRGVPFAELEDWEPARPERARLIAMMHDAEDGRCAALIADAPSDAVAEATRLVGAEPLREHRWALLMLALDGAGRRAEALRTFDHARRALATELGVAPGRELVHVQASLLADEPPTEKGPSPVGSVPTPVSSLIGRENDTDTVVDALNRWRLVTLTGVGGVGKSRLAIATASARRSQHPGGVWFVSLTSGGPGDVETLIAAALGPVAADGRMMCDRLADTIGSRNILLVLDNAEHVLDAVASSVVELLGRCPGLRVLVSSRRPLGVSGERRISVAPLALDGAARELFTTRAAEAGADVDHGPRLDQVTARLAGIPLVIELAAANVGAFGLAGLAERLAIEIDVPRSTSRSAITHHRTVRAALDWSWDLLDRDEQRVFARLGVFRGAFDLAAASAIAGDPPATDDVGVVLGVLVDASLVVADHASPAPYRLLEPVRQYAADRLIAAGEAAVATVRHANHMAAVAEALERRLSGHDELAAASHLEAVRGDLRAAFRAALERDDVDIALRIVAALGTDAQIRIRPELWSWGERALALPGAAVHRHWAVALVHVAAGAWQLGDHGRAVALAEEAIGSAPVGSDAWLEAHRVRSSALMWLNRLHEAIADLRAAIDADPAPHTAAGIRRRATLALLANHAGLPADATPALLNDAVTLGQPSALALAHHTVGTVLDPTCGEQRARHQRLAATLAAEAGDRLIEGFALAALATLSAGEPDEKVKAITDVMAHYLRVGNHTHLRSFGRGAIVPLAATQKHAAVVVLDAATRDQPTFGGDASRTEEAGRKAVATSDGTDFLVLRGETMTDEELVAWMRSLISRTSG